MRLGALVSLLRVHVNTAFFGQKRPGREGWTRTPLQGMWYTPGPHETRPLESTMRVKEISSWLILLALFLPTPCQGQGGERRLTLGDTHRFGYRLNRARIRWAADRMTLKINGEYFDALSGRKVDAPKRPPQKKPAHKPLPEIDRRKGEKLHRQSPDGTWVSFIRNDNLYLRRVGSAEELAISKDGNRELLYGHLDWVYQEEVYGRGNFNAMWWSPNSSALAFLKIDESQVKDFVVVDHVPNTLKIERTNYPKAGDGNPVAFLGVYDIETKKTDWVDLSRFEGSEPLIVHVGWNPAGDKVVFQVQNRIQNWLELMTFDVKTKEVVSLIREESKTGWVNRLSQPVWLKDGTFFWWSERTGFKHLYHYRADGTLINAVTQGPWVNKGTFEIDEEARRVYFYANRENPAGQEAWMVSFDGSGLTCLTPGRGTHRIVLNGDGTLLIDRYSHTQMPPRTVLRDMTGKILRVLDEATLESDFHYSPRVYMQLKARDGFMMDATLIKPHDFDPKKSYPIMLFTYSGPDAPSVRDAWSVSPWHQFVAQEGALVLQVNNRSSSGRGQKYIEACYLNFGKSELRDLVDAVKAVGANSWANLNHVGISGWSYGGFMAAYAVTCSDLFTMGVAGAGVYDWALYDTIYTERYMSTPQRNPKGYAGTSCLKAARRMKGYLLLFHGTMDDNVHLQNTIKFAGALQEHGKDFDMMIYPRMRHGPRRKHQARDIRRRSWKAIRQHLLQPAGFCL